MSGTVDPRDVAALEKAVNDAAGRAGSVWLSFITLAAYLIITTGSVTHKHLFLEKELKLPVFAVDLPLVGLFVAGPLLFVIVHFYSMLQLHGLAGKIAQYEVVLREAVPHRSDRQLMRQRLDTLVFVQVLAGARERREGIIGFLNRLMAWITVVILPLAVLLLTQIIFLPYQRELVTWLHRVIILVDLAVIWWFWGTITSGTSPYAIAFLWPRASANLVELLRLTRERDWFKSRVLWLLPRPPLAASVAVGAFSLLIAASPTETIYLWPWRHLTTLMFEGGGGPETDHLPRGLLGLSNHLVLPDEHFVTDDKLKKGEVTLSLRGRNLHSAVLDRSDLTQVDFTGADLRRASLQGAKLQRARFLCIGDVPGGVRKGESLRRLGQCALLDGAWLNNAQLQGAYLNRAHLQSARLLWADLRGASLEHARLQGATLWGAQLQGAFLNNAQLQGAGLSWSYLQGASLNDAQLQGAGLLSADLRGASLDRARLQGAFLLWADLEGATLWGAQLQGASPSAMLYRTSLSEAFVYRASVPVFRVGLWEVKTSPILDKRWGPEGDDIPAGDAAAYERFVHAVVDSVPSDTQILVRNRLQRLAPTFQSAEEDAADAKFWSEAKSLSIEEYHEQLADTLTKLSCDAAEAPHVARGLIRHGRLKATGEHLRSIAEKLKHPAQCPGAEGLTAEDLRALE